MIGRILAWILFWILFLLAVAAVGRDAFVFLETTAYSPVTLGDIWHAADPASFRFARGFVERYVHSVLRANVLSPLLRWPAWAVLSGIAVVVALLFGRRQRRKWRSGSLG